MRSRKRDQPAELATLMKFEALLRTALSKTGFLFFSGELFYSKQLLHCVRDLVWTLTRAVPGGNDKGVHAIQLAGFPMPAGFRLRQLGLVVAWNHRVSSSPPRDDRCDDSFLREQETSDCR
jgi:hypothetical protein